MFVAIQSIIQMYT